MVDPIDFLYWYGAGLVISAVALGFYGVNADDEVGGWLVAIIWPLVLVATVIAGAIAGPFWLGRQMRKCFDRPHIKEADVFAEVCEDRARESLNGHVCTGDAIAIRAKGKEMADG